MDLQLDYSKGFQILFVDSGREDMKEQFLGNNGDLRILKNDQEIRTNRVLKRLDEDTK